MSGDIAGRPITWQEAREHALQVAKDAETARNECLEREARESDCSDSCIYGLDDRIESLQSQLQAKTEECERLKETLAQRSTRNWVDMTPDSHLPERLLSCYIDESYWSDNTGGVPATNPVVVAMNEHREQRNAILRAALAVLDAARKDDQ